MTTGICVEGPLGGTEITTPFPKGFLYVDKPNDVVWVYVWNGKRFQCREPLGEALISDPNAPDNRWRAAEEDEYGILVMGAGREATDDHSGEPQD